MKASSDTVLRMIPLNKEIHSLVVICTHIDLIKFNK